LVIECAAHGGEALEEGPAVLVPLLSQQEEGEVAHRGALGLRRIQLSSGIKVG
jgi:hypothetical protein